jgi:hypothetical protein
VARVNRALKSSALLNGGLAISISYISSTRSRLSINYLGLCLLASPGTSVGEEFAAYPI